MKVNMNQGFASRMLVIANCVAILFLLSSCRVATVPVVGPGVGPVGAVQSYDVDKRKKYGYDSNIYLSVVVPRFDPNIPQDSEKAKDVWREVRWAEANRFAWDTKQALENIGIFDTVSVVPNTTVTSDLYVLGKILESDSEVVKLEITLGDIAGNNLGQKTFRHKVKQEWHWDPDNAGKNAYEPVFQEIAEYVYKRVRKIKDEKKVRIKDIAALRFAENYSEEAFAQYLKKDKKGRYSLQSFPEDENPMFKRIKALRVEDELFIDDLQKHYRDFHVRTNDSYLHWQQVTLPEIVAARKAKREAFWSGLSGAVAMVGAIASVAAGDMGDGDIVAATSAAVVGHALLENAMDKSAQSKVHKNSIQEAARSLDIQMGDQVRKLQGDQGVIVELSGTSAEQYKQWQEYLQNIYNIEKTPDVEL